MKLAVYLAKEVAAILRAVLTHETKKLYNDSTVQFTLLQLLGTADLPGINCTHRPDAMLPGNANDPAVAWHGLQRMPNHPNSGGRRLLARVSVTGLGVPVMRIPYRSGFLPTGPQLCCNSCKRRRADTVLRTRLGWTRKWLQRTFPSNGRRLGLTDVCSSRSGNYRDGSWESNIRLLTGTIKS